MPAPASSRPAAYLAVNVLADPEIRQGIQKFSSWPTIPQLYINGQFVGGSDIMSDMYQKGELQKLPGVREARLNERKAPRQRSP